MQRIISYCNGGHTFTARTRRARQNGNKKHHRLAVNWFVRRQTRGENENENETFNPSDREVNAINLLLFA